MDLLSCLGSGPIQFGAFMIWMVMVVFWGVPATKSSYLLGIREFKVCNFFGLPAKGVILSIHLSVIKMSCVNFDEF